MSDGSYQGYRAQCESRDNHAFLTALLACLTNDSFENATQKALWQRYDEAAERAGCKEANELVRKLHDNDESAWLTVMDACRGFWNTKLYKAFHGMSPFASYTVLRVSASDESLYLESSQMERIAKEIIHNAVSKEELRTGRGEYALLLPPLDYKMIRVVRKK